MIVMMLMIIGQYMEKNCSEKNICYSNFHIEDVKLNLCAKPLSVRYTSEGKTAVNRGNVSKHMGGSMLYNLGRSRNT